MREAANGLVASAKVCGWVCCLEFSWPGVRGGQRWDDSDQREARAGVSGCALVEWTLVGVVVGLVYKPRVNAN